MSPDSLSLPPDSRLVDRRGFLTAAGASAVMAVLASACGGDATGPGGNGAPGPVPAGVQVDGRTLRIDLSVATGLQAPNGFLIVAQPSAVVVHLGNSDFRAFTAVCTHSGCLVSTFANGRITCPCHGSQFDTQGQVVRGPAPSPLRSFPVTFDAMSGIVSVTTA
jgi:cytochrome b6-f complex iron-sulfur subunit